MAKAPTTKAHALVRSPCRLLESLSKAEFVQLWGNCPRFKRAENGIGECILVEPCVIGRHYRPTHILRWKTSDQRLTRLRVDQLADVWHEKASILRSQTVTLENGRGRDPKDVKCLATYTELASPPIAEGLTCESTHATLVSIMIRFSQILRQLRKESGLGIKKLAPYLAVDYSYLSKLESDTITPSPEMVGRVAKYFHYDYNRLLLSAGKVPDEILTILRENPDEALQYLRERFGRSHGKS